MVHFLKNGVTSKVNWTRPTIIVPDSPNYPDTDVMVFDPTNGLLVVCQFTVQDPFTNHSRNFFEMKASMNLSAAWEHVSGGAIKKTTMLWITTNKNAARYNNDLVVTSAELEARYAELRGFVVPSKK